MLLGRGISQPFSHIKRVGSPLTLQPFGFPSLQHPTTGTTIARRSPLEILLAGLASPLRQRAAPLALAATLGHGAAAAAAAAGGGGVEVALGGGGKIRYGRHDDWWFLKFGTGRLVVWKFFSGGDEIYIAPTKKRRKGEKKLRFVPVGVVEIRTILAILWFL